MESTPDQLRCIAAQIRACCYDLALVEEYANYIVGLVSKAIELPGAFPEYECLRREIARLQDNYREDWPMRALLAIATAFAPGFDPSTPGFMVGGFYTGGWEAVREVAGLLDNEAELLDAVSDQKEIPTHLDGFDPDTPNLFWHKGKPYRLPDTTQPEERGLLTVLYGKPSMDVSAVLKALGKPRNWTYRNLKTTSCDRRPNRVRKIRRLACKSLGCRPCDLVGRGVVQRRVD
jgi:hypothetical protein